MGVGTLRRRRHHSHSRNPVPCSANMCPPDVIVKGPSFRREMPLRYAIMFRASLEEEALYSSSVSQYTSVSNVVKVSEIAAPSGSVITTVPAKSTGENQRPHRLCQVSSHAVQ